MRVQFKGSSGGQQSYNVHVIRGEEGNLISKGTTNEVVQHANVKTFAGA